MRKQLRTRLGAISAGAVSVFFAAALACCLTFDGNAAPPQQGSEWRFAVSGDSRNCGDVVMPAIAAGVHRDGAAFYWHLGDFRAIYAFDEDIVNQGQYLAKPLVISDYESMAWQDFIDSQLARFGTTPVFLALGNHETIPPMSRTAALEQFADWLNTPPISRQRLADDPGDHRLKAYYHWMDRGVAFFTLDNSTADQFDNAQLAWLEKVLALDAANPAIRTVVVGMHEALPDSLASNHAMDDFPAGIESGRRVYADLLRFQNSSRKRVYVLASHSHFFMENIYDSPHWRANGGVLQGWIVGTAGAVRYDLPPGVQPSPAARKKVYGYMLATVAQSGEIRFDFKQFTESDLAANVPKDRYKPEFVHWCFDQNTEIP